MKYYLIDALNLPSKNEVENYIKNLEMKVNFLKWDKSHFESHEKNMVIRSKSVYNHIEKDTNYYDPDLRQSIFQYIKSSLDYVEALRDNRNNPGILSQRKIHAKEIIKILKKEESLFSKIKRHLKRKELGETTAIGNFITNWKL